MIRVFELFKRDIDHSPGNAMTLCTVCAAYPDEAVEFHAFERHVQAVDRQLAAARPANLRTVSLGRAPAELDQWPGWRQAWFYRGVLRPFAVGRPSSRASLWFILFGHGPLVRGVRWAVAGRPDIRAQYLQHGELSSIVGWRSPNPLHRHFDLRACLESTRIGRELWLVLEPHILANVQSELHLHETAVRVLPYQIDLAEGDRLPALPLEPPIRFCAMGLQTRSKGFHIYQPIAKRLTAALGRLCQFHVCGVLHASIADHERGGLVFDFDDGQLVSRDRFLRAATDKHYVVLPYEGDWYRFSLSGALYDAINFRKPVIALTTESTRRLFAQFGDLGYLCDTVEALERQIRAIAEQPDPDRYARQRENLGVARRHFSVREATQTYRGMTDELLRMSTAAGKVD